MKKYPDIFNNTYSSLVTAGDSSGNLDVIFDKLADYLEGKCINKAEGCFCTYLPNYFNRFFYSCNICFIDFCFTSSN